MSDLNSKLLRCISSIFPTLSEEQIRTSDLSEVIASDSLTAVTLLSLIDEEFGVNLDLEELLNLGNFDAIEARLRRETNLQVGSVERRMQ